jgi:hypothetical protein
MLPLVVEKVPRAQKIGLSDRKSWCRSNDPGFVAKAAGIAGLNIAGYTIFARERDRGRGRQKAFDPGFGASARHSQTAGRVFAHRLAARL